jgi:4-hydroxybenzoate polyprenyltransferase
MTPNNQVLLLLPLMFLLRDWKRLPRAGRIAFTVIAAWPWLASLFMLFSPPTIESSSRMPLLPSALVLLFPFLMAALMFVRFRQSGEALTS